MSNIFVKRKIPFTQIPNSLLNRSDISLKAKGLWAFMSSKPDGWDFSATRISDEIKEDRKAVLSALKELVQSGFLLAQKLQDGRMRYILLWEPEKATNFVSGSVSAKKELTGSCKTARPLKKDYSSDEEYEKAFYAWNSSANMV